MKAIKLAAMFATSDTELHAPAAAASMKFTSDLSHNDEVHFTAADAYHLTFSGDSRLTSAATCLVVHSLWRQQVCVEWLNIGLIQVIVIVVVVVIVIG